MGTGGRGMGALAGRSNGGKGTLRQEHWWEGDTETWALEGWGWGHLQIGAMVGRGY